MEWGHIWSITLFVKPWQMALDRDQRAGIMKWNHLYAASMSLVDWYQAKLEFLQTWGATVGVTL